MKKILFSIAIFCFIIFHFHKIGKIEQRTALNILDLLRTMELEITPDETINDDKLYFSEKKYARRLAIMDCEQLIYEKYRLWQ